MSENTAKGSVNRRQGRSPAYPSVSLAMALEKARAQYDIEGKYPAPLPSAFKAWGYSPKSSGGRDVRASLRYFGLIVIEGDGDMAKARLTEDALRVLTDKREDQTEKNGIIRRLALNPTAHKKIWAKFPEGIKSVPTAVHYLQWEENYNESAASALIEEFKETAAFARLYERDIAEDIQDLDAALDNQPEDDPRKVDRGADPARDKPPAPKGQVAVMESERVAFIEESQPGQYLKLIACGSIDDFMLEALEDYVKRQRRRLASESAAKPS